LRKLSAVLGLFFELTLKDLLIQVVDIRSLNVRARLLQVQLLRPFLTLEFDVGVDEAVARHVANSGPLGKERSRVRRGLEVEEGVWGWRLGSETCGYNEF
jgi:hypothetical protein